MSREAEEVTEFGKEELAVGAFGGAGGDNRIEDEDEDEEEECGKQR